MKTIITISGDVGHGKSFLADAIATFFNCQKVSFSEPLKEKVAEIISENESIEADIALSYLFNRETKEKYRDLLTSTADKLKEYYGSNYFAKLLVEKLKAYDSNLFVIDDLRYEEELKALKEDFKVFTIKITRPGYPSRQKHSSDLEYYKLNFDLELINDDTMDYINKAIKLIVL